MAAAIVRDRCVRYYCVLNKYLNSSKCVLFVIFIYLSECINKYFKCKNTLMHNWLKLRLILTRECSVIICGVRVEENVFQLKPPLRILHTNSCNTFLIELMKGKGWGEEGWKNIASVRFKFYFSSESGYTHHTYAVGTLLEFLLRLTVF